MILKVGSSNIETFKTVEFGPGMNLVVAEKSADSTDTDTRNGVGKTLLINIIHFCLGGSFSKDGPLGQLLDKKARFFVKVNVQGQELTISREVGSASPVLVGGMPESWLEGRKHETDELFGEHVKVSAGVLNDILGEQWYDIPTVIEEKFKPSFRPLFEFAVRNGPSAYMSPFTTFPQQAAWQTQLYNAYLLRLGWEFASRWQAWKEKSDQYKAAAKALESSHLFGQGTKGEMESEVARLRVQWERTQHELAEFRVVEEYEDIKKQANRLSREMQERQNQNVADSELLRMYESSLVVEQDAEPEQVARMFEDAGIVFPTEVKKTLNEVKQFHHELVENRKRFLDAEIQKLRGRMAEREERNRQADTEKSQLLKVLQSSGALDEFTALQNRSMELGGQVQVIQSRIENLERLEQARSELDAERVELERESRNDHIDRRNSRKEALGIFDEYVRALYDCKGDLIINLDKNGFKFDSKVERDHAEGIGKMEVFCYDLLVTRLWATQDSGPRLLIHDTTLFDGVEERQKGHALQLASREATSCGFQYISFWNSDSLPSAEYLGGLDVEANVVLRLDDTEAGSLLGYRFD